MKKNKLMLPLPEFDDHLYWRLPLPAINLELESAKSNQPVPVLQDLEKKEVEKKRLPETREQAVWVGRMKTFLAVWKFGLLLAQAEKVYEKDWGESLPVDWRVRMEDMPDIIITDDGVSPPFIKLTTIPASAATVESTSVSVEESLAGQLSGLQISEEPR